MIEGYSPLTTGYFIFSWYLRWLDDFKDYGDDDDEGDSINCAQIVTLGKLGFWDARECNGLKVELASSKCCGASGETPTSKSSEMRIGFCALSAR
jgi:hypothetical protein